MIRYMLLKFIILLNSDIPATWGRYRTEELYGLDIFDAHNHKCGMSWP